jgi:hypothetical protein
VLQSLKARGCESVLKYKVGSGIYFLSTNFVTAEAQFCDMFQAIRLIYRPMKLSTPGLPSNVTAFLVQRTVSRVPSQKMPSFQLTRVSPQVKITFDSQNCRTHTTTAGQRALNCLVVQTALIPIHNVLSI